MTAFDFDMLMNNSRELAYHGWRQTNRLDYSGGAYIESDLISFECYFLRRETLIINEEGILNPETPN